MRSLSRVLLAPLFAVLSLSSAACSAAGDETTYKEGTHYKSVREVSAPANPKRIVVNEFFWYGCSHCFAF